MMVAKINVVAEGRDGSRQVISGLWGLKSDREIMGDTFTALDTWVSGGTSLLRWGT